ncbi:hypothetical protein NTH_03982 [Nitratireductor thuwali]|uniref:Major facilitator superfamily (MFS) profile domain-containing protein n=1 Tax=Nitratireductor thuwali TaxID=2267699 RepID=A0ABY5MQA6_9HYPH|nr:hypothetical protein NTH_03982 [Nitratireductor thuwali]
MSIIKALFRTVVGITFGIASMLALTPAFAAFLDRETNTPSPLIWLVVLLSAVLGFFAPTIRRAFGRGFLLLGLCVLALPISMMMLSGRVSSDMMAGAQEGTEVGTAIGSGIASLAMTGVSAFIGFFLGSILVIVGLVLALGGRREVILRER